MGFFVTLDRHAFCRFGVRRVGKTIFYRCQASGCLNFFFMFFGGIRQIMMTSGALETALEFDDLSWRPGGPRLPEMSGSKNVFRAHELVMQTALQQTACRDSLVADSLPKTRIQE